MGLNSLHIYFPYNNNIEIYHIKFRFKEITFNSILIYIYYDKKKTVMNKKAKSEYISKDEVNEMIENALRRHNRRSTILSSV